MLFKKATVKENALKNAQKSIFWAKVIMRYFQKYVRYECKVFGGSKDIPWAQFETITRSPTHPTTTLPHAFSQQLSILAFFELFLPKDWARQEISQQMKPIISKGHSMSLFCFFSVFCDSRSQYWSYDYIVYIFFHLQNIPQLLLGTDFLFDVEKICLRLEKWPRKAIFKILIEYSTNQHASFSKFRQIRSLLS